MFGTLYTVYKRVVKQSKVALTYEKSSVCSLKSKQMPKKLKYILSFYHWRLYTECMCSFDLHIYVYSHEPSIRIYFTSDSNLKVRIRWRLCLFHITKLISHVMWCAVLKTLSDLNVIWERARNPHGPAVSFTSYFIIIYHKDFSDFCSSGYFLANPFKSTM